MELTGIDKTNRLYFEPLLFLGTTDPEEIQILAGVIEEGSPAAAAALGVDLTRKTGRIVSIYTRPDMRRRKAGAMLMEALFKLAGAYSLNRMECFFTEGMNGLLPFLEAQGFRTGEKQKAEGYRMADLIKKKRIRSILRMNLPVTVRNLESIKQQQRDFLTEKLKQEGYGRLPENLDEELSVVVLKDGMPCAALLCSLEEGEKPKIRIQLVVSFAKSLTVLMGLMAEWMNIMMAQFGTEADLGFYAANPKVSAVLARLAKPTSGQQVCYAQKDIDSYIRKAGD